MEHYMKDTTTQWNGERSSKHVKYQRVPYQSKNVWEVRKIPSHMRQTWLVLMFCKSREIRTPNLGGGKNKYKVHFLDSSFKTLLQASFNWFHSFSLVLLTYRKWFEIAHLIYKWKTWSFQLSSATLEQELCSSNMIPCRENQIKKNFCYHEQSRKDIIPVSACNNWSHQTLTWSFKGYCWGSK